MVTTTDAGGPLEFVVDGQNGVVTAPTPEDVAEGIDRLWALTPERLREISRQQVGLLKRAFESLDIDPGVAHVEPMPEDRRAGFLALRCPRAGDLSHALRARGVFTDVRGDLLRLGPAPYLSDDQLRAAVQAFRAISPTDRRSGLSPRVRRRR